MRSFSQIGQAVRRVVDTKSTISQRHYTSSAAGKENRTSSAVGKENAPPTAARKENMRPTSPIGLYPVAPLIVVTPPQDADFDDAEAIPSRFAALYAQYDELDLLDIPGRVRSSHRYSLAPTPLPSSIPVARPQPELPPRPQSPRQSFFSRLPMALPAPVPSPSPSKRQSLDGEIQAAPSLAPRRQSLSGASVTSSSGTRRRSMGGPPVTSSPAARRQSIGGPPMACSSPSKRQSIGGTPVTSSRRQSIGVTPIALPSNPSRRQSIGGTPVAPSNTSKRQSIGGAPVAASSISRRQSVDGPSVVSSKRQSLGGSPIASDDSTRNTARYNRERRAKLWEGVELPIPAKTGFSVVVPGSSTCKEFHFGPSMLRGEMYGGLARYLVAETRRKGIQPIVMISQNYPDSIYDMKTFGSWVEWIKTRPFEERVLLAV